MVATVETLDQGERAVGGVQRDALRHNRLQLAARIPHIIARQVRAISVQPSATLARVTATPWVMAQAGVAHDAGITVALVGDPILEERNGECPTRLLSPHLLELYRAHGKRCLEAIAGCWVALIMDGPRNRTLIATDRMGRTPLYYRLCKGELLVDTDLHRLVETAGPTPLSAQSLFHYLYFHMVPADDSIYEGCHKLRAGECAEFVGGDVSIERYWRPAFGCPSTGGGEPTGHGELKDELRHSLTRAVQRSVETSDPSTTAAFLSGGLDSSTIAGIFSEINGAGSRACAVGFDVDGYDEMPYARITAKHFGLNLDEYYVTADDLVDCVEPLVAGCDEPFGNSSILPTHWCALMASRQGVRTMLAGDGGDELFAGNERYARQRIFNYYQRVPPSLRDHLFEPLARRAGEPRGFAGKLVSYIRQASLSVPARLYYYSFTEQFPLDSVFTAAFCRELNPERPLELVDSLYRAPEGATELERMLFLDWQLTLADNDLRKVGYACDRAGVKVHFPMLDDDVVAMSCRIPSELKLRGGNLRSFYKEAMHGWLPPETIAKKKHGFGLPVGAWLSTNKAFRELASDAISQLRCRRIFRESFLDQVISPKRTGEIAYYGQLVWVLMALEIWLATHEPGYVHESR